MCSVTAVKTLGERAIPIAQFDSFVVRFAPSKCRSKPRVRRAGFLLRNIADQCIRERDGGYCRFTGEGTMVDSFIFHIDWIIVSVAIGLLVALIGAFLYPRRDHD